MIESGARVNKKSHEGDTPLHSAVLNNSAETAELLIKNGAGMDALDEELNTPLNVTVQENSQETINVMLDNEVDIPSFLLVNGAVAKCNSVRSINQHEIQL